MKANRKKKRLSALVLAMVMAVTLVIPAASAQTVNAATDDVTITKIELITPPDDSTVLIDNGYYSYDLSGAKLKVTYSNGGSENLWAWGGML